LPILEWHFWLHIIGTMLYVVAMWTAGIVQGLMWRDIGVDGTLTYAFLDSLIATKPFYFVRWLGGCLILGGMGLMGWNLWHTAKDARKRIIQPIPVPVTEPTQQQTPPPIPAGAQ